MTRELPTLAGAKRQARDLRRALAAEGTEITHARALEITAAQYGFRDWNALCARVGTGAPPEWRPGARVEGSYLSQPFRATIVASETVHPGWFRLVLDLDEPVDVVRFESFSNLRRRITGTVGPEGHSRERTSDGIPQLVLNL